MRFSVWPDPKAVTVDTDAGPLAKPRSNLHSGTDTRYRLCFEVEPENPDLYRPASQIAGAVPQVLNRPRAVHIDFNGGIPVEQGLDPVWGTVQDIRPQFSRVLRKIVRLDTDRWA